MPHTAIETLYLLDDDYEDQMGIVREPSPTFNPTMFVEITTAAAANNETTRYFINIDSSDDDPTTEKHQMYI